MKHLKHFYKKDVPNTPEMQGIRNIFRIIYRRCKQPYFVTQISSRNQRVNLPETAVLVNSI